MKFDSLGKAIKSLLSKPVTGMKEKHGASLLTALTLYRMVHMVVIQEDIAEGEHIRKYLIEAKMGNK